MSEFDFIDEIRRSLATSLPANQRLPVPPGDDCAEVAGAGPYLFAADMLLGGVHFDLRSVRPELVGRKALAVNLSDIAAMAGTPASATVCLALPRQGGLALGRAVMSGMIDLAREHDLALAGGDTNSWDGPLVVSVAITGVPHPKGSVQRRGARPGDVILVTGQLGGSLASGRHLTFPPRIREAHLLHDRYGLTAMVDLSDGLASDLGHILTLSGVSACLERAALPLADAARASADPTAAALTDGEDFELCLTLPEPAATRLLAEQPFGAAVPLARIGVIGPPTSDPARALTWSDGSAIVGRGYSHSFT